jgi:hypothetical protein
MSPVPAPTGNPVADLLAERRAVIQEMRAETDATARELLAWDVSRIDAELEERRDT